MPPDVAGATFMAAGSSAPELATAVIGVFVAQVSLPRLKLTSNEPLGESSSLMQLLHYSNRVPLPGDHKKQIY